MHEVNLRTLDLNLLVILQALLEERQVTRAAERLDMSQPAVSRALARLRKTFDDPLLVKSAQGFDLSTRAESLKPRLNALLKGFAELVVPSEFDPKTATDRVRIACLDMEGALFLPELLKTMRTAAPGMQLSIHSQPGDHFALLQSGEVDFVISGIKPARGETQIMGRALAKTEMVCLMDADNPLAHAKLTLEGYIGASHGVVSITGLGAAIMDRVLEQKGLSRRLTLRTDSFTTLPDYIRGTDLIFALPKLTTDRLTRDNRLVAVPLPSELELPQVQFDLYWHARQHRDPMHRWVRNLIKGNLASA